MMPPHTLQQHSFKYDPMYSTENERSGTDCRVDTVCLNYGASGNTQKKEGRCRSFFRKHYRKHSQELVNALQGWKDQLQFTTCEYKDGRLLRDIPESIEPEYVPYFREMKLHLDKAYSHLLLPSPAEIESQCETICMTIEKIITSQISTVPIRPSYERIIIDKIRHACPDLKTLHDLTQNNIYLKKYIFSMIFDAVKRQADLDLRIIPGSKNNTAAIIV
jgi:hypothetical protein